MTTTITSGPAQVAVEHELDPIRAGLASGACRKRFIQIPHRFGIDEFVIGVDVLVASDIPNGNLGEWSLVVYDLADDLDHRLDVPGDGWAAFVGADFQLILAELGRYAYASADVIAQVLLDHGYIDLRRDTSRRSNPDAIPASALNLPQQREAGMVSIPPRSIPADASAGTRGETR